jgi:hypothetical protein
VNENCARWINCHSPRPVSSVEECIKKHKCPGPGCVGCAEYPKEWETTVDHVWDVTP